MQILQDVTVHSGRFLKYMETVYLNSKGDQSVWEWTTRDGIDSVVIAAFTKSSILVIEEERIPIKGVEIGLPAGLLSPNESVGECATRELFEESGMTVKREMFSSPFLYNSAGMTDEKSAISFVRAEGNPVNTHAEDSEVIVPRLIDKSEVAELLKQANTKEVKMGFKAWFIFTLFLMGAFENEKLFNCCKGEIHE